MNSSFEIYSSNKSYLSHTNKQSNLYRLQKNPFLFFYLVCRDLIFLEAMTNITPQTHIHLRVEGTKARKIYHLVLGTNK